MQFREWECPFSFMGLWSTDLIQGRSQVHAERPQRTSWTQLKVKPWGILRSTSNFSAKWKCHSKGVCVCVCVGGWVVPQCMKLPYWSYCLISLSSPGSLHRFRQRSFPALLGDARDWLWNIWHEKHEFYHQLKASLLVRNKSMNQKENKTWTNTLVL